MMKLMYVPTGNIFTLPDAEALEIKKNDRGNYKILDAGYVEEIEEVADEKTVAELVMQEETPQVELPPAQEEAKQEAEAPVEEPAKAIELEELTKPDLLGLAMKLGVKASQKDNKDVIIEKIRTSGKY